MPKPTHHYVEYLACHATFVASSSMIQKLFITYISFSGNRSQWRGMRCKMKTACYTKKFQSFKTSWQCGFQEVQQVGAMALPDQTLLFLTQPQCSHQSRQCNHPPLQALYSPCSSHWHQHHQQWPNHLMLHHHWNWSSSQKWHLLKAVSHVKTRKLPAMWHDHRQGTQRNRPHGL